MITQNHILSSDNPFSFLETKFPRPPALPTQHFLWLRLWYYVLLYIVKQDEVVANYGTLIIIKSTMAFQPPQRCGHGRYSALSNIDK